jgi:hypothetical protein
VTRSSPRSLRYCMRAARGLLSDVWSDPVEAERPSIERLDALLFWLDSQQASGIEGAGIHPLLTHVVDEAGAICAHVATEIQGPPRVPKSPRARSSRRASRSGSASLGPGHWPRAMGLMVPWLRRMFGARSVIGAIGTAVRDVGAARRRSRRDARQRHQRSPEGLADPIAIGATGLGSCEELRAW